MAGGRTWRRRAGLGAAALMALAIASCGRAPREPRPAWRDKAERACLRSGVVKESAYIERAPAIDGPGACGVLSPFHVSALSDGKVGLSLPSSARGRGRKAYAATLTCAMLPAVEGWMSDKVQTAAAAVYGQPVVEMHTLGSYSCRRMNNGTGTHTMSEHAFADAIDISGFTLADGREVMVRSGWRGAPEDQEFMRSVFVGACEIFHTVLGPGSDGHHEDHFHLDLMRHASGHHICRPVIKFEPRSAPALQGPVQPPVAPEQLRQEPEADDPYALDDAAPPSRAVAARAPTEPEFRARVMRQPTRPLQPYAASAPALAAHLGRPDDGEGAAVAQLPASSKGDRLDRVGPRRPLPLAPPGGSEAGNAVAKDPARLGAGEPSSPRPRPAYAALPPRPPGVVPAPARPAPSPRTLNPSPPPGWSVGAQPVMRLGSARGAEPPGAAADPDE